MGFVSRASARSLLLLAPLAPLLSPAVLEGQDTSVGLRDAPVSPEDSTAMVEDMHRRQADFERFRQSRIPVSRERARGGCDQQIGRICIWYGGEGESDFPEEPPETERARAVLIGNLIETYEQIGDPWVTGQLVHYLVEHGDLPTAEKAARRCGLTDTWWCEALLGYVLHVGGDFLGAEDAFREALATMPDEELSWWITPRYIVSRDVTEDFEHSSPEEQERLFELFWRLSDPLFLLDGNDRFTDHFARLVEARNFEDADNPQGLFWEEDLEETLIRYGRIVGWSRSQDIGPMRLGGGLRDPRHVVGHHNPRSRGYVFPEEFLTSPSDVPPESWITAPREARSWYAPPYAPDFRALETQVGRFRRGDEMLVVGAYRPEPPRADAEDSEDSLFGPDQRPGGDGPVQAALFLVPEGLGETVEVRGNEPAGVFTLRAPPGRYVSSLEVLEPEARRAWRARQGVHQEPLVRGLVGVSDLMILEEGAPFPASLDDAIPHLRPNVRVGRDERFAVVWEVYGLGVAEPVQATVGFTRGRPGFLGRVGEFLGVLEPEEPVEVTFEGVSPDRVESMFRVIELQLPDVDPGEYTLHLRLDLVGREPVITSRPIVVEE